MRDSLLRGRTLLKLMLSGPISRSALRIALGVGTLLNLINQGAQFFGPEPIAWWHVIFNYLVPFCVAGYSAAYNQLNQSGGEL